MTRQIAVAIFLAAMLTMIVGGAMTYAMARQTLLDDLDRSIIDRAVADLPPDAREPMRGDDRFVLEVDDASHRTVARSRPAPTTREAQVEVLSRSFTAGSGGERQRTLVIRMPRPQTSYRAVYSVSAAPFDKLQRRLAIAILATIAGGGLITAITAAVISRRVTQPLQLTSDAIASVSDSTLNRRIETTAVPVELRPTIDRLNELLARLETAFAGQREFLADAAHELRTPVAAMRAGLEIALSRPRSAEHLEQVLQRSLRDALQMGEIVEAMLDCVRTGAERPVAPVPFDISPVLTDCVEQVRPLAAEKSQKFHTEFVSMRLCSEEMPLRTIVRNLLSNALSHTPPAGVITVAAVSDSPRGITIEVSDTGKGIAPEQIKRVFEPFYRGDASRSDGRHLGLGLYIARRHALRLGGNIDVSSVVGTGTVFRVFLPNLEVSGRVVDARNNNAEGAARGIATNLPLIEAKIHSQ